MRRRQTGIGGVVVIGGLMMMAVAMIGVVISFSGWIEETYMELALETPKFDYMIIDGAETGNEMFNIYVLMRYVAAGIFGLVIAVAGLSKAIESADTGAIQSGTSNRMISKALLFMLIIVIFPPIWDALADGMTNISYWVLAPDYSFEESHACPIEWYGGDSENLQVTPILLDKYHSPENRPYLKGEHPVPTSCQKFGTCAENTQESIHITDFDMLQKKAHCMINQDDISCPANPENMSDYGTKDIIIRYQYATPDYTSHTDTTSERMTFVDATFEQWAQSNPGQLNFERVYDMESMDILIKWEKNSAEYGGYSIFDHNAVDKIVIVLGSTNISNEWALFEESHLKSALAHEIGHILGLGHSTDINNLMWGDTNITQHNLGLVIPEIPSPNKNENYERFDNTQQNVKKPDNIRTGIAGISDDVILARASKICLPEFKVEYVFGQMLRATEDTATNGIITSCMPDENGNTPKECRLDTQLRNEITQNTGLGTANDWLGNLQSHIQVGSEAMFVNLFLGLTKALVAIQVLIIAMMIGIMADMLVAMVATSLPVLLFLSILPKVDKVANQMLESLPAMLLLPLMSAIIIAVGAAVIVEAGGGPVGTTESIIYTWITSVGVVFFAIGLPTMLVPFLGSITQMAQQVVSSAVQTGAMVTSMATASAATAATDSLKGSKSFGNLLRSSAAGFGAGIVASHGSISTPGLGGVNTGALTSGIGTATHAGHMIDPESAALPSLAKQREMQMNFVRNSTHDGHTSIIANKISSSMNDARYKWDADESRDENADRINGLIKNDLGDPHDIPYYKTDAKQREAIAEWNGEIGLFAKKLHAGRVDARVLATTLERLSKKYQSLNNMSSNRQESSIFMAVSNVLENDKGYNWRYYKAMIKQ
ncbi:MAG: matrixin family metalloprotease [Thaumarchaeota archaeon]|nr:matrixin family metalloprotease [Nitrososphaerota archaeon]